MRPDPRAHGLTLRHGFRVCATTDKDVKRACDRAAMTGAPGQRGAHEAGRIATGPGDGVAAFASTRKVRFSDIDGMGHVNNAVYLSYMEEARFDWVLDVVGVKRLQAVDFILAHVTIDYLAAATLGDEVRVQMWVPRIGGKSWDFAYRLSRVHDDVVLARALTTQVAYDYAQRRPKEIPDGYRPHLDRLYGE